MSKVTVVAFTRDANTEEQRRARISQAMHWMRRLSHKLRQKTAAEVVGGIGKFVYTYPALVFGLMAAIVWTMSAPAVESLPANAQTIYQITKALGIVWLVVSAVWRGISVMVNGNGAHEVLNHIQRSTAVVTALLVIRVFGVELADAIASAKANPDAALALVVAVVLLRTTCAFAPTRSYPATGVGVTTAEPRRE